MVSQINKNPIEYKPKINRAMKYKIDPQRIKSSGKKLVNVGYLLIFQLFVSALYVFVVFNSKNEDDILVMTWFTLIVSAFILYFIIRNIILSGNGFEKSIILVSGTWEEYHENGNLKCKGEYKDGNKEGTWEFYYSSGKINPGLSGQYKDDVKISNEQKYSLIGVQLHQLLFYHFYLDREQRSEETFEESAEARTLYDDLLQISKELSSLKSESEIPEGLSDQIRKEISNQTDQNQFSTNNIHKINKEKPMSETKPCIACAEEIKVEARLCKHCQTT